MCFWVGVGLVWGWCVYGCDFRIAYCVSDLSVFLGRCGVGVFMDATLGLCIVSLT